MKAYTNRNAELLEKYINGDKSARNDLCMENMGLVKKIVSGFSRERTESDDLIQIGAIGLIKAIDKFDPSFGVSFSTYAVPMILGEIKRFLRDDGIIKVSRSVKQTASAGFSARERLKKELGREPTVREISGECGVSVEELTLAFDAVQDVKPLYKPEDGESDRETDIEDCRTYDEEKIIDKILVHDMLKLMPPEERQIIVLRYFRGKSQQETADIMKISQVQVSRIEKKIFEKMRRSVFT